MSDQTPETQSKRRFWIALLIIAGSATAAALYFVVTTKQTHIPFESMQWKDASILQGREIRQTMLLDLQQNVLHRGMPRSEIESLLGDDGMFIPGDHDLAYFLGSAGQGVGSVSITGSVSHFPAGNQYLTLTLNEHDQLVHWQIVTQR